MRFLVLLVAVILSGCSLLGPRTRESVSESKQGFVSLADVDGTILLEMRYATAHNFVGNRVPGYEAAKCLLTQEAAKALVAVQADLKPFGLSLKMYDCYRPQRAVSAFVEWAKQPEDQKTKQAFYPHFAKEELFQQGYIASQSGHTRGSTVDLTLVSVPPPLAATPGPGPFSCTGQLDKRYPDNSLEMGTSYDCLDTLANTQNALVGKTALQNRALLKYAMERHGFKNYEKEWWHFSLADEPYPKTYFDFPIE